MDNDNTFHVGITMAGAVSAGAFSAGFMDYLLEVMGLWEDYKEKIKYKIHTGEALSEFEKKIPLHNVCIDAIGGASAGGMVGVLTALSTFSNSKPVKEPSDSRTGNILYDSWVLLDDDSNDDTFIKMLRTDDFDNNKNGIPSLLNSTPIDQIAERVFRDFVQDRTKWQRPSYISEDFRILVTLCSLRGVPFELNFETFLTSHFPHSPGHRMKEHMIVAHFKLKYDNEQDRDQYLKFDPFDDHSRELLKLCTKATGAFPIGLAPRQFQGKLSKEYIKNCIIRNLPIEDRDAIVIHLEEEHFDFTNVDGGTINNEPYSEVVQTLEEMNPPYNSELPMFGTIMIDPFPNFYDQDRPNGNNKTFTPPKFQRNIWDVLPKLYAALKEQVLVKHSGSFYKDYFRLLVFPIKWEQKGKLNDHPPLSCAALGGFGGFLDMEFRKHDFFLGRNNARNFLRAFFMLEYDVDDMHPLFRNLSPESIEAFKRVNGNSTYFPIIPDINYLWEKENGDTSPFKYTISDFPQIDANYFSKIEPHLRKRIKKMLGHEISSRLSKKVILRLMANLFSGYIAKRMAKTVLDLMKDDLRKRKMLK